MTYCNAELTSGPQGRVDTGAISLVIQDAYLACANIQHQTQSHLMSHGVSIPTETRILLAKLRDAAEVAAERARRDAKHLSHVESAPTDQRSAPPETSTPIRIAAGLGIAMLVLTAASHLDKTETPLRPLTAAAQKVEAVVATLLAPPAAHRPLEGFTRSRAWPG